MIFKLCLFINQHLVRWILKKNNDEYNVSAWKSKGIIILNLDNYMILHLPENILKRKYICNSVIAF